MVKQKRRTETVADTSPVLMTLDSFDPERIPEGGVILRIPCDQLSRDENQPRTRFNPNKLTELAESIRTMGLQQYPVVNYWKTVEGEHLFKIKAGERRWQSHKLLGRPAMLCIVEPEKYSEVYDSDRALTQAAENSSREPHTVAEIVHLVRNVVASEKQKRQGNGITERGVVDIALRKVEKAFGKKEGWAASYHQLGRLSDELLDMMDSDDESEPTLKWSDAIALVTASKEEQAELLKRGRETFPNNPRARAVFISREARARREGRGEKVKGRNYEAKQRFLSYGKQLKSLAERATEGRTKEETLAHINQMVSAMGVVEIEEMMEDLRVGLFPFVPLFRIAREARESKMEASNLKFVPAGIEEDAD